MTTFEHAMVGVNGALAAGLTRRCGWKVASMAGLVAVSPDWDGLTLILRAWEFTTVYARIIARGGSLATAKLVAQARLAPKTVMQRREMVSTRSQVLQQNPRP